MKHSIFSAPIITCALLPLINPINLYKAMPNSRLLLLPDAGDGAMCQYLDLFVQEAVNFLDN
jgi:hypothetical protein